MRRGAIWSSFAAVPVRQAGLCMWHALTFGVSLGKALSELSRNAVARTRRAPHWPVVLIAVLGIAGCAKSPGSFDDLDSGGSPLSNLVSLVQLKKPPPSLVPAERVVCPDIVILDGMADDRVYGKGDATNANLRYQFSLNDVARDCKIEGNQISLKIGAAGKILLGPVGAPGSFTAPVRIAIVRESDQEPVVSKLYGVPVTVPSGRSEAPFTLVTDQVEIPYTHANAQHDYTIKVGFDAAGNDKRAKAMLNAARSIPDRPDPKTAAGGKGQPRGHQMGAGPSGGY